MLPSSGKASKFSYLSGILKFLSVMNVTLEPLMFEMILNFCLFRYLSNILTDQFNKDSWFSSVKLTYFDIAMHFTLFVYSKHKLVNCNYPYAIM